MEIEELMERSFNDARVYIPTTVHNITEIHSRRYCAPRSAACKEYKVRAVAEVGNEDVKKEKLLKLNIREKVKRN